MYICICKSVTDSDIKAAAAEGITDMPTLSETLGCSTQCGKCERIARRVLEKALTEYMPHMTGSTFPEVAFASA